LCVEGGIVLNDECALFIRRAERAQYVIEISEDKRMMTDHRQESRFFKHAVSPMYVWLGNLEKRFAPGRHLGEVDGYEWGIFVS
jgi:hypothetical protein